MTLALEPIFSVVSACPFVVVFVFACSVEFVYSLVVELTL